jgi:hypothetical protein
MLIALLVWSTAVWAQTNYNGDRMPASEKISGLIKDANDINGKSADSASIAAAPETTVKRHALTKAERKKIVDDALKNDRPDSEAPSVDKTTH